MFMRFDYLSISDEQIRNVTHYFVSDVVFEKARREKSQESIVKQMDFESR